MEQGVVGRRIMLLENTFGNSMGERVIILSEDNDNIYYNDGFHRWTYIPKTEEGISFKYCATRKRRC